jgi:hypothetical protein
MVQIHAPELVLKPCGRGASASGRRRSVLLRCEHVFVMSQEPDGCRARKPEPGARRPLATLRPVWAGRAYLPLAGVVAVAAAALLAAGCGGDDPAPIEPVPDASDQGSAALSKSDFIAQGDAICGEVNAALSGLDTGTAASDPKFQAAQELQFTRSQLQSLESLPPPSENRSALDSFLSALEDQVDALSRKKAAVDQGDDPLAADAEAASAAASAQAAAQDYGFQECANASEAPTTATTTSPAVTTTPTPTTPTTSVPTTPAPAPTGGTGGDTGGGTGSGGGAGGGGGGAGGGTGGTGGGVSP